MPGAPVSWANFSSRVIAASSSAVRRSGASAVFIQGKPSADLLPARDTRNAEGGSDERALHRAAECVAHASNDYGSHVPPE